MMDAVDCVFCFLLCAVVMHGRVCMLFGGCVVLVCRLLLMLSLDVRCWLLLLGVDCRCLLFVNICCVCCCSCSLVLPVAWCLLYVVCCMMCCWCWLALLVFVEYWYCCC